MPRAMREDGKNVLTVVIIEVLFYQTLPFPQPHGHAGNDSAMSIVGGMAETMVLTLAVTTALSPEQREEHSQSR